MKYTLEIPVLVLSTIPSDSTRMIVASLHNLPLTVLKSSASASVADRSAKIASVVAYSFMLGAFCLFCSPHGNDKMMHKLSQMTLLNKLTRHEVRACSFQAVRSLSVSQQ